MNFTFTAEQINTILKMLDSLPHGQVRPVFDYIVGEAQNQIAKGQEATSVENSVGPAAAVEAS